MGSFLTIDVWKGSVIKMGVLPNTEFSLQAHYSLPSVGLHAGYEALSFSWLCNTQKNLSTRVLQSCRISVPRGAQWKLIFGHFFKVTIYGLLSPLQTKSFLWQVFMCQVLLLVCTHYFPFFFSQIHMFDQSLAMLVVEKNWQTCHKNCCVYTCSYTWQSKVAVKKLVIKKTCSSVSGFMVLIVFYL